MKQQISSLHFWSQFAAKVSVSTHVLDRMLVHSKYYHRFLVNRIAAVQSLCHNDNFPYCRKHRAHCSYPDTVSHSAYLLQCISDRCTFCRRHIWIHLVLGLIEMVGIQQISKQIIYI